MKKLHLPLLKMRRIIFSATILFLLQTISLVSKAQATDPGRGIYVNNFFALNPTTVAQVPEFSILCGGAPVGLNYQNEIDLLQYCKRNHFTYIVLYDLGTIFNNQTVSINSSLLIDHLKRFITLARTSYGIIDVGANIGGVDNSDDVIFYNANRSSSSTASVGSYFTAAQTTSSNPIVQQLNDFISQPLSTRDDDFPVQQATKLFLQVQAFSALAIERINFLSVEYEFWNTSNSSGYTFYRFQQITNRVHDVKVIAGYPLKSEIYLARFTDGNPQGPIVSDQTIADLVDYKDANGVLNFDRVMLTYYTNTAPNSYLNHQTQRNTQLDLSSATTNPNTEIFPLFSTYLPSGDPNFGKWINENSKANIFLAEREFYEDAIPPGSSLSNVITTAHNMWYRASEQACHRSHQVLQLPTLMHQ